MQILPALINNEYSYVVVAQDLFEIISQTEEIDYEDFGEQRLNTQDYHFSEFELVLNEPLQQLLLKEKNSTNNVNMITPFAYHIHELVHEFSETTTPYFNFSFEQIQFEPTQFRFLTFDIPYADVSSAYDGHKCIVEHFGKKMVICYQNGKLIHHLICCKKLEGLIAKQNEALNKKELEKQQDTVEFKQQEEPEQVLKQEPEQPIFADTFAAEDVEQAEFITMERIQEFLSNFECVAYRVTRRISKKPPNPYEEVYNMERYQFGLQGSELSIRAKKEKCTQRIVTMTWVTELLVDGIPYLQAFVPDDPMFAELNRINMSCMQNATPLEGYSILVIYCENTDNYKLIMMNKTARRIFKLYEALRNGELRIRVRDAEEWTRYNEQSEFERLKTRFIVE